MRKFVSFLNSVFRVLSLIDSAISFFKKDIVFKINFSCIVTLHKFEYYQKSVKAKEGIFIQRNIIDIFLNEQTPTSFYPRLIISTC